MVRVLIVAQFCGFQRAKWPAGDAASVEKRDQLRESYSDQLFWNDGVDDQLPEFGNPKFGEAARSKANQPQCSKSAQKFAVKHLKQPHSYF